MPQQEISLTPGSLCQQWTRQQLDEATERFSADRKIYSGQFADIYRGQKGDRVYAIKWLKEMDGDQTDRLHSFFQTEAQITFRCAHPNLLPLLGFCLESGHRCLIYHYMQNGSLDAALQEDTGDVLSWEKRLAVAAGLLQAVSHLHEVGLFHGNIKSSNVFLDDTFSPKLGHSGPRFCPDPSASYTQMKTQDLQRHQAYLPDTYMRRGQLTAQTDIFSVGVVLAELLTGYKSYDKGREPIYLKDLILKEMEQAKVCVESAGDKKEPAEHLCAREVAQKHADVRPGRPPGSAAFYLACAACLCLSKKKVLLSEVIDLIEKAENEFKTSSRESKEEMSSWNVPEESDEAIFPGCAQLRGAAPSCHSPPKAYGVSDCLNLRSTCHMEASEILTRRPCELDESGQYFLSPGGIWCDLESDLTSSKAATSASTNGHATNHHFSDLNSP
ncbi:interleukin-1 receptor-associated kinase-like 2 isoform X2 [Hyperolius riggenbachi]